MSTNMLKIGDYFIIILIIVASGFLFYNEYQKRFDPDHTLIAQVLVNGKIVKEIDLKAVKADDTFVLQEEKGITVEVSENKIRIKDAKCPDKLCVNRGWLERNGDSAICLPLKTVVKINGRSGVDSVAF